MPAGSLPPKLLVLDASYTLEMIRERGLEQSVTCRDLDGFFGHVWSVHPFATLLTSPQWASRFGRPVWVDIDSRNTFIEGKVGRFKLLAKLFPLNFLLAQVGLFVSLWRLVRKENIAAVRVGDPLYLGLFGLLLSRLCGIPLIIRVNGNNDKVRKTMGSPMFPQLLRSERIEKAIERYIFPRADWVFAPNEDNLQFAVDNGARREQTGVVSFGSLISNQHFIEPCHRPSAEVDLTELNIQSGQFMLVVGRLMAAKFPDHAIRVLARIGGDFSNLKLIFVGDGELKAELVKLAKDLSVADRVLFIGNRSQDWLARVMPHSGLVLSPSTGRALSEAALAETAIVAYDTDWQRDIIDTDRTGILVPYMDWEAMAAGASKMLADPAYSRAMARAVRQRAVSMLDTKEGIKQERGFYSQLLKPVDR